MSDTPWYESFFGKDYLRIYTPFLPPEKSDREVQDILNLLNLPPGSAVLDLCCGDGRHTLQLARQGYQMTGLDLSAELLERARTAAEEQNLSIRWIRGDMRQLPFQQEFDAVINIFTSFGYLPSEDEDQKVLQQVERVLKPGGLFLLETVYQPRVVRAFVPHGVTRYEDGMIVVEERHIDPFSSRNEVHVNIFFPDGRRSEYYQSIRIYTLSELVRMLGIVGLHLQAYYGGLNASPLTLDSRMVILSQKSA